ncbi:MAG TPA: SMI1/KNR4 family protein [Verrucomicrobiota bacterium]|nr:SMI1/KNR4 family protein [Verrucomicrobiota bacterium]
MDNDYLKKVLELASVSNPYEQPTEQDWRKVELELGIILPDDYKNLLSKIGNGHFGDLVLLNPVSSAESMLFNYENTIGYHQTIRWGDTEIDIPLFPDKSGFLHIGGTGFNMLLLIEEGKKNNYKICCYELDVQIGHILDMTLCRFLYDMYNGLIREKWALECREIIWFVEGKIGPFFTSRPGIINTGRIDLLNG